MRRSTKTKQKRTKNLFVVTFLSCVKIINKVLKMICSALVILVKYVNIIHLKKRRRKRAPKYIILYCLTVVKNLNLVTVRQ